MTMQSKNSASRTGFGFEAIMQNPQYGAFREWWNERSFFALTRDEIEEMFSSPEDVVAEIVGPFSRWSPPACDEAA